VSGTRKQRAWHLEVDRTRCLECAGCVSLCPTLALDMHGLHLACEDPRCIGCDLCVRFCPVGALALQAHAAAGPPAGETGH
jgi:L-aspartate semialdehyde sulfurtransferase ferredoxin